METKETNDNNIDYNQRKLLHESNQWSNIRIRPYYDPATINTNILSSDTISYIKSLISASINYLQQFVYIIPISGPLKLNRCQKLWFYNEFTYSVCTLADYQQPPTCQYAAIPEDHLAESWYYDPLTFKSTLYRNAGPGTFTNINKIQLQT